MKRFWKEATAQSLGGGWGVQLDGRPLRTPARAVLELPVRALAEAVAQEWQSSEESVDPRAMPLTGMTNAAIDRVGPDRASFSAALAKYGESDLLYYRSERPPELAERQQAAWDPLLAWARARYDITFRTTVGVQFVSQPEPTLARLSQAVDALDPFRLAAMAQLVTIGGSLIAALAIQEGELSAEQGWIAVTLDDRWNLEKWGADAEAEAALANRARDFLSAAEFLRLLD